MNKKISALLALLFVASMSISAQIIRGSVHDENKNPLMAATVAIKGTNRGVSTDLNGVFRFGSLEPGEYTIEVKLIGFELASQIVKIDKGDEEFIYFTLKPNLELQEVEVFGERFKQPEKLDAITRMPLRPSEQIQSISIISEKVIQEQGALTITDVVRNVPGVTLFGSYGGVRESLSTRGYRGVPILKNGVRVDSDFRTASLASDMQGVESVQVIKGSAAITQGVGNDLGSPGGVINVVTKTPKFVNKGEVGIRTGSWGQFRPTFDVQSVLDIRRTFAFRLNGAYERADGFKRLTKSNRIYVNPSIAWRPDDKTHIVFELDYLDDDKTPDVGTVNLAGIDTEALYKDAREKFFGFTADNTNNKTTTYAARITRQLTDVLSVRAAFFGSSYHVDQTSSGLKTVKGEEPNIRDRTLGHSRRDDQNKTIQLDLIGRDVYTGSIKHTFQLGFDYKRSDWTSTTDVISYNGKTGTSVVIDRINVFDPQSSFSHVLPDGVIIEDGDASDKSSSNYGIMVQDVTTFNKYLKAVVGLRYSSGRNSEKGIPGVVTEDAWNPMVGVMVSPIENVNIFGSYTTTTDLRSAANKTEDGDEIGASYSKQWEAGVKSDWLNNRLRFNFTYFNILNNNIANQAYKDNGTPEDWYYEAGNLKRQGVEVELSGRVLDNLQVMLGYAYLSAKYKNSPSYVEGSAPMNAPKHTANGWVQYTVNKSILKGLSIGVGSYYVGDRPVNEWSTVFSGIHGNGSIEVEPGVEPFDMPSYLTVNAQVSYTHKGVTARIFFNNIFDELGYNSYFRGGYINQIDPRNFAAQVSYSF